MDRPSVKLKLDLKTFDETPFLPILEACLDAGLGFESLRTLGDTAEHRRRLYDLNKACSADIPGRGAFYSIEDYSKARFERDCYDPKGVLIALDRQAWVGLAVSSDWSAKGFVFNEMTGVVRDYRRRGAATAMKLLGLRYARSRGVDTVYTIHDAENDPAIRMNRRLGFVDTDWERLV